MLPPMMAVNGPPNGEQVVDLDLSPDPAYSPHLTKSPLIPQPDTASYPAPVSPGKKRVRISDSPSIRVIEDPPMAPSRPVVQYKSYYQQFNSDYISRLHAADGSPLPLRPVTHSPSREEGGRGEEGGRDCGESLRESLVKEDYDRREYPEEGGVREYPEEGVVREYTESLSKVEQLTFPEYVSSSSTLLPSLHDHSPVRTESPFLSLAPFKETNNRIFLVTDPQGLKAATLGAGKNGTLYVVDSVTGWPLKRSPSLESRDNPFLPGGNLSREAEDLLSKATIVRDKFYLDQQQRQDHTLAGAPGHPTRHDLPDGALPNDGKHPPSAVEDRVTATAAAKAEATPDPHPRENGKASDGVASPDGVRVVEVGGEEGARGAVSDSEGGEQDKDKAKRRNKCCVVM
ncbi:hypothetical protein ACOMHN_003075 [Nucella lapillus]